MGWGGRRGEGTWGIWSDQGKEVAFWFSKCVSLARGTHGSGWPRNARFTRQRASRSTSELIQSLSLGRGRIAFPLTCGPPLSILFFLETSVQRMHWEPPTAAPRQEGVSLNVTARGP